MWKPECGVAGFATITVCLKIGELRATWNSTGHPPVFAVHLALPFSGRGKTEKKKTKAAPAGPGRGGGLVRLFGLTGGVGLEEFRL